MIEDTILTGLAVFLGSIAGGICVAEYTLMRGKNMIAKGVEQAIKQYIPMIKMLVPNFQETWVEEKKRNELAT